MVNFSHVDEATGEIETLETVYGSSVEWFKTYWRHRWLRRIDGSNLFWSAYWWKNVEATERIEIMWNCWEAANRKSDIQGASMNTWWLQVATPHMNSLMQKDTSPFVHNFQVADKTKGDLPLPHSDGEEVVSL
jgi:Domain of unknown function (DUF4913)